MICAASLALIIYIFAKLGFDAFAVGLSLGVILAGGSAILKMSD